MNSVWSYRFCFVYKLNVKCKTKILKASVGLCFFEKSTANMSESMGYVKKNRMTTFYDIVFSGIGMGK